MDKELSQYRKALIRRTGKTFPCFAHDATSSAPILAILETPGRSGAVKSRKTDIDNDDPTAKRQKEIISSIGIDRKDIVFWNFFAAYEAVGGDYEYWGKQLTDLIKILPNLKVVLAFGDKAWRGVRELSLPTGVMLIGAPHPSNRACNANPRAVGQIKAAWARAKSACELAIVSR